MPLKKSSLVEFTPISQGSPRRDSSFDHIDLPDLLGSDEFKSSSIEDKNSVIDFYGKNVAGADVRGVHALVAVDHMIDRSDVFDREALTARRGEYLESVVPALLDGNLTNAQKTDHFKKYMEGNVEAMKASAADRKTYSDALMKAANVSEISNKYKELEEESLLPNFTEAFVGSAGGDMADRRAARMIKSESTGRYEVTDPNDIKALAELDSARRDAQKTFEESDGVASGAYDADTLESDARALVAARKNKDVFFTDSRGVRHLASADQLILDPEMGASEVDKLNETPQRKALLKKSAAKKREQVIRAYFNDSVKNGNVFDSDLGDSLIVAGSFGTLGVVEAAQAQIQGKLPSNVKYQNLLGGKEDPSSHFDFAQIEEAIVSQVKEDNSHLAKFMAAWSLELSVSHLT